MSAFPILNHTLVREFYRSNAGFFLLVIGLGGGFMRGADHIALAEFFIGSPLLLSVPVILWTFYAMKVVNFNAEALKQDQNEFLFHVVLFPPRELRTSLLLTLTLQLAPAFLYGFFLLVLAFKHKLLLPALLVVAALTSITAWATWRLHTAFHHPHRERKVSRLKRRIDAAFTKPSALFVVEWVVRQEPVMLAGTKIMSILVLWGVSAIYKTESYDLRLMAMGASVAFAANLTLLWHMHRFEHVYLTIMRQLPIPLLKRMTKLLFSLLILTLPETGFLLKSFPPAFTWQEIASCYTFALSILAFLYGFLYQKDRDQEQFISATFFIVMTWIVAILFGVPLWALAVINFVIGLSLWGRRYYTFEVKVH